MLDRFSILLCFFMLGFSACANEAEVIAVPNNVAENIKLPAGFKINVYADLNQYNPVGAESTPRMMAFDAAGNLYVSLTRAGKVVMLEKNKQQAEVAGALVVVAENLNAPHGLALVGEKLYVANQDGIVILEKNAGKWPSKPPVTLVKNLPTGGHSYKSLKLGPDGLLYLNVGSSCNVCEERDPLRATILRFTTAGKPAGGVATLGQLAPAAIYSTGLRNSQGFVWHPQTGAMFATNEGADNRSETKNGQVNDDIPPEHLNQIEVGKHYGWPHCWGDVKQAKIPFTDPNFVKSADFCNSTTPPAIMFDAHSTPIGITFLNKTNWPSEYQQDAMVALHGSWNRKSPSGYKLVRVRFKDNQPVVVEDFATGWLNGKSAFGRPVDVAVGIDGALYVSDDRSGLIYRISH